MAIALGANVAVIVALKEPAIPRESCFLSPANPISIHVNSNRNHEFDIMYVWFLYDIYWMHCESRAFC